jgi:hypothetical protein
MKAYFLMGSALAAAPVSAQAPLPMPSAAATELAALLPVTPDSTSAKHPRVIETDIMGRLFGTWTSRGPGCDPSNPECRAVAIEMAKAYAGKELAFHRRRAQLFYAYRLGDLMTEAEMRESIRFLKTASGRKLVGAMEDFVDSPAADPERWRLIAERVRLALPEPRQEYVEAFFEQTKHLPRRPVPAPPAPPRPNRPYSD